MILKQELKLVSGMVCLLYFGHQKKLADGSCDCIEHELSNRNYLVSFLYPYPANAGFCIFPKMKILEHRMNPLHQNPSMSALQELIHGPDFELHY